MDCWPQAVEEEYRRIELGESMWRNNKPLFCNNKVTNSKYSVTNFLPKSILEQFRRLANIYFLGMGILMLIGTYAPQLFETPLGALTTLGPLVFVLGVSLVQEGVTDCKRHQADTETNHKICNCTSLGDGSTEEHFTDEETLWMDVQVGDILKISNKEALPADMVIFATSEDEGVGYIETAQIDGETNLKLRRALPIPQIMGRPLSPIGALDLIKNLRGTIECEAPNMKINSFTGSLLVDDIEIPIDNDNVALRGSVLRNTKWAYGVVVYTGVDTKLQKNSRKAPSKLSRIDLLVNQAIYIIFLIDIILTTISTVYFVVFADKHFSQMFYVGYKTSETPATDIPTFYTEAFASSGDAWQESPTPFISQWITYIILYNNFIPISMYVTMEVITFVQLLYVNYDTDMYYPIIDMPAKARSTNVTDLGQVEYIFSDKTGTLTQNVMKFKRCAIDGRIYGSPALITEANRDQAYINLSQVSRDAAKFKKVDTFFKVLTLCHTVVVENDENDEIEYQAESPDEKALVEAAASFQYVLNGRTVSQISANILGKPYSCIPLAVNKFDSDRKRMSIVIKEGSKISLLVKGADSAMLHRGVCDTDQEARSMVQHLGEFSQEGLRTLVIGIRELSVREFEDWFQRYKKASTSKNRATEMTKVADEIENDLTLVGVSAIEDKLQDGVPEAIADLADAGIKLCVLTGDKMETAINIGYSCRVLREGMYLLQLGSGPKEEVEEGLLSLHNKVAEQRGHFNPPGAVKGSLLSLIGNANKKKKPENSLNLRSTQDIEMASMHGEEEGQSTSSVDVTYKQTKKVGQKQLNKLQKQKKKRLEDRPLAFIMEGPALLHVLGVPELEMKVFELMQACNAVIACRMSPKQKAELVRLVKDNVKPTPTTLAIGDGANDVGMILEAHVGIGISGNEGQQAVNSSDFAIAQFRFLKRLLLVHGRWNYRRMAKTVLYSFYKNVVLVMTLFFYCAYNGWSGTSVYEDMILAAFNLFLGFTIFVLGLFDRDITATYAMAHPELYISGRKNLDLNYLQVLYWMISALVHGSIVYGFTMLCLTYGTVVSLTDFWVFGLVLYIVLCMTMQYKCGVEYKSILYPVCDNKDKHCTKGKCAKVGWTFDVWVGSILVMFLGILLYQVIDWNPNFYGVATEAYALSEFWLPVILIPFVVLVVDILFRFLWEEFVPSPVQLGIERCRGLGECEDVSITKEYNPNPLTTLRQSTAKVTE